MVARVFILRSLSNFNLGALLKSLRVASSYNDTCFVQETTFSRFFTIKKVPVE